MACASCSLYITIIVTPLSTVNHLWPLYDLWSHVLTITTWKIIYATHECDQLQAYYKHEIIIIIMSTLAIFYTKIVSIACSNTCQCRNFKKQLNISLIILHNSIAYAIPQNKLWTDCGCRKCKKESMKTSQLPIKVKTMWLISLVRHGLTVAFIRVRTNAHHGGGSDVIITEVGHSYNLKEKQQRVISTINFLPLWLAAISHGSSILAGCWLHRTNLRCVLVCFSLASGRAWLQ